MNENIVHTENAESMSLEFARVGDAYIVTGRIAEGHPGAGDVSVDVAVPAGLHGVYFIDRGNDQPPLIAAASDGLELPDGDATLLFEGHGPELTVDVTPPHLGVEAAGV